MASEPPDREQQTPPRRTARRVQPQSLALRQQNESDDRQAGQRANHQRQHQKYLVLTLLQLGQEV